MPREGSLPGQIIFHHVVGDGDGYPHAVHLRADCYCEPEMEDLGWDCQGFWHKVVRHQDLRGKILTTTFAGGESHGR